LCKTLWLPCTHGHVWQPAMYTTHLLVRRCVVYMYIAVCKTWPCARGSSRVLLIETWYAFSFLRAGVRCCCMPATEAAGNCVATFWPLVFGKRTEWSQAWSQAWLRMLHPDDVATANCLHLASCFVHLPVPCTAMLHTVRHVACDASIDLVLIRVSMAVS
jgi:hypothetical protein